MRDCFEIVAGTIFDILVAILGGWMLSYLWLWFIAPTFGLPRLNVVQAIGIGITVNFVMKRYSPPSDDGFNILTAFRDGLLNVVYLSITFSFGILFSFFM